MTSSITSRDDLPFTAHAANGELEPWQPKRHPRCHDSGVQSGLDAVAALGRLAEVDEYEAYIATVDALLSPSFGRLGEELGLVEGLAGLAMVGLRAQAERGALPFDPRFDAHEVKHCTLLLRAELMEQQLKKAKMRPWRTQADARQR